MRSFLVLLFAIGTVLLPARTHGQDDVDAVAELRSRVELLEQKNLELKAAIIGRRPGDKTHENDVVFSRFVRATAAIDENSVRSVVEEYLAQRSVQVANLEVARFQPAAGLRAEADAPRVEEVGSDLTMVGKWTPNGPELQTKDGAFKAKIAGRVQIDSAFIESPDPTQITSIPAGAGTKDSVFFRRLRLGCYGTMWEQIDWVTELDFATLLFNVDPAAGGNNPPTGLRSSAAFPAGGNVMSVPIPCDVSLTFRELPFGSVRVGNQKERISLENMNSVRFLDFMERSPLQDAFNGPNNNGFTPGISVFDWTRDERAAWSLGVFKNNDYESSIPFNLGNNNYTYNSRLTWTPYYDELAAGRYLLFLGFGSSVRTFENEPAGYTGGTNVRLRVRGDIRNVPSTLSPNYADTGNFYTTNQVLLNPEIALVYGPLFIQAEYEYCTMGGTRAVKNGPSLGAVQFQGGYVEALYFLTGEHRAYSRQTTSFGRVVPFQNAFWTRDTGFAGSGAWQVGIRYDWIDLNSGLVKGGNVHNLTAGVNWFLNPQTKVQFNYVAGFVDAVAPTPGPNNSLNGTHFVGKGVINSAAVRLAWDF